MAEESRLSGTRFSIVITCYNQCGFIKDAVNSALALRYVDKEIIVVDDGSTDGSQEILTGYGNAIQFVSLEKNCGASGARNHGASLATGRYLVFLDGDDIFLPWALSVYERIVELKNPKVILSDVLWFEGNLPIKDDNDTPSEIVFVDYETVIKKDRYYKFSASSLVVERHTFEAVNGWSSDIFPLEDVDLTMKLGYSGCTVQIWSPPITCYRIHADNATHRAAAFVAMVEKVTGKERAGQYPGGSAGKFERYAFLGGPVAYWVRRTLQARMYYGCMRVIACGWLMILAKIVWKLTIIVRGTRPLETTPL